MTPKGVATHRLGTANLYAHKLRSSLKTKPKTQKTQKDFIFRLGSSERSRCAYEKSENFKVWNPSDQSIMDAGHIRLVPPTGSPAGCKNLSATSCGMSILTLCAQCLLGWTYNHTHTHKHTNIHTQTHTKSHTYTHHFWLYLLNKVDGSGGVSS